MAILSPREIAARLDSRFELLRTSRRDVASRHATLERAIDWSFEMLPPWERAAFAQCAVFSGGFTLEAAEVVIELSVFRDAPPVLDVLQALRQKSLVQRHPTSSGTRLTLYESLREYALCKLTEGGGWGAAVRHARFYVEAAERWTAQLSGRGLREALEWLSTESKNLLSIARVPNEAPDLAFRAALSLDFLLARVGPNTARLDVLDRVAGVAELAESTALRRYLRACAEAQRRTYRLAESRRNLERALSLARRAGDEREEADLLLALGDMEMYDLTYEKTQERDRETVTGARKLRDPVAVAVALICAYSTAGSRFDEAQAAIRRVKDPRDRAVLLHSLAMRASSTGDLEQSLDAAEEARGLAEQIDEPTMQAEMAVLAASLEHVLGRVEDGPARLEQVLARNKGIGNRLWTTFACTILGAHRFAEGRLDEASALFEESGALCAEDNWDRSYHMAYLGAVEAKRGRLDLAEREFGRLRTYSDATSWIAATIELSKGVLELARARAAAARGQLALARAHEAEARRRYDGLSKLRKGASRLGALLMGPVLERALQEHYADGIVVGALSPDVKTAPPPPLVEVDLELEPRNMSFRTRHAGWVSVERRHPLRRILLRLIDEHLAAPGELVRTSVLIEAGWPGQRMRPSAAANRLRNAIAVLRGLGLRGMLLTREDGYALDPAIVIGRNGRAPSAVDGDR